MWCRRRRWLLRKSEGSEPAAQSAVSRWIKPGEQEEEGDAVDAATEGQEAAEDEGKQQHEEKPGGKTSSSAPPSCYSMAALAAAAAAPTTGTGSKQRTFRTSRSYSSRSTSHLSSYDLASALNTINHILMTKSMRTQKATRLIGPEDPTASPRKRSDKVLD